MAKYRTKPVEIEAFEWKTPFGISDLPDWFMTAVKAGFVRRNPDQHEQLLIENKGKHMRIALPGDWIILDGSGLISTAKPAAFKAEYEPVTDGH